MSTDNETVPTPPAVTLLGVVCTPQFSTPRCPDSIGGVSDLLSVSTFRSQTPVEACALPTNRPPAGFAAVVRLRYSNGSCWVGYGTTREEAAAAALADLRRDLDLITRHSAALLALR